SLVVYESWFGNTQRIAEEITDVLAAEGDVAVLSVDDPFPSLLHVDLVILGAPTHVHGLSSGRSRQGAIDQCGGAGETGIGVRGWIEQLPLCGGRASPCSTPARTSRSCSSAPLRTELRTGSAVAATAWPSSPRASSARVHPVRSRRESSSLLRSG